MAVKIQYVERQVETLAPLVTMVAVHAHQIDEGSARMQAIEDNLDTLLTCVNNVKVKVEGMSVRLGFIVGASALIGGGIVTAIINALH